MNQGRDRPRGPMYGGGGGAPPPNQPPPRRGTGDSRNGSGAFKGTPPPSSMPNMSRAEKFEMEKRKIMETCFAKQDPNGAAIESYITHVRVVEDAAYPSNPPPPSSSSENKKARVIIVAVRQSGRVRMHKARENQDGSFSIGKTWVLDDLTAVQGYTLVSDQNQRLWAGDTGFCVSIGKPYYWSAPTAKEKDFFIASLVKIYRKYTGGKIPEVVGFDVAEREAILGGIPPQPGPPPTSPAPPRPQPPMEPQRRPETAQSSFSRPPSSQGNRSRPPSPFSNRAPSRDGQRRPSQEMGSRNFSGSQDKIPPMPGQLAPGRGGPPFRPTTPQSQGRELSTSPGKSRTPFNNEAAPPMPYNQFAMNRPNAAQSSESTQSSMSRTPARSSDTENRPNPGFNERSEFRRGPGGPSPDAVPEGLPERRRPPIPQMPSSFGQKSTASEAEVFSTPMATPSELRGPSRNISRPTTRDGPREQQAYFTPSQTSNELQNNNFEPSSSLPDIAPLSPRKQPPQSQPMPPPMSQERLAPSASISTAPAHAAETSAPPEQPISPPATDSQPLSPISPTDSVATSETSDTARPGLGPMMKKKSQKDLANILRKAATAQGAFKPRAGGAAQRFLAAAATAKGGKNGEPDGITGVVPAPLLRGINTESGRGTPEQPGSVPSSPRFAPGHERKQSGKVEPPIVQITRTATEEDITKSRAAAAKDKADAAAELEKKRARQAEANSTYCAALGIDPSLIGHRGGDFMDLLSDLGWDGEFEEGRTVDDMEADIRRELGRVQASSWLGHLEQQEQRQAEDGADKVESLASALDSAIEECEKFDGLLTLYSHELGTLAEDVAYIENQWKNLEAS